MSLNRHSLFGTGFLLLFLSILSGVNWNKVFSNAAHASEFYFGDACNSMNPVQRRQGEVNGRQVSVSISSLDAPSCYTFHTSPSPIKLEVARGWDENCTGSSQAECTKLYVYLNGREAKLLGQYEGYNFGYRIRANDRAKTEYKLIIYNPDAL